MATDDVELYLPSSCWGLDPLFNCHIKLYIKDILFLRQLPSHQGIFFYKNHPVLKVDILGIVVRREERHNYFVYAIDDGTGVISCSCIREQDDTTTNNDFDKELPEPTSIQQHELGDLIRVRGKVKVFCDVKEVSAHYHVKVDDPNAESARMIELPMLYKKYYDVLFTLPNACNPPGTNGLSNEKMISFHELKRRALDGLNQHKTCIVSRHDLLNMVEIQASLDEFSQDELPVVDLILDALTGVGQVFKCQADPSKFVITSLCSELKKTVLDVLRKKARTNKYTGWHAKTVLAELRRFMLFKHVEIAALTHCLETLEQESLIISSQENCYFAVDVD